MIRQKSLFTTTLPASQEFNQWGWQRSAILGTNTGKFRTNPLRTTPMNQKVILIDTSPGSLMDVAMIVPHLNTVISTGAELFSLMEIKHVDKDGEEIEDSLVLKFLEDPNPLQSLAQYLYEFYVLNAVYNKTFQHMIKGISYERIPDAMWLLPSGWMKINATGKLYRQTDINEIIVNYEMLGDPTPFEVEKVIYMAEGIGGSILNPISRIEALQIPLSNIVAALKSRNIIISERGMIGFISSDGSKSDSDGQLPLDKEESKKLREEYQRQYSLDGMGGHVGFTHANVKWVPMTFDVEQLQLGPGMEDDFSSLVAAFRHDRDLYPSTKGATFENKDAGMRATIQNALLPLANKFLRGLTKRFIDYKTGEKLIPSYQKLVSMSKEERLAAQAKLYRVQAASQALSDNVISHDQYAEVCEYECDGTKQPPQPRAAPGRVPANPNDDEK